LKGRLSIPSGYVLELTLRREGVSLALEDYAI
jgi:hypothetical protein